MPDRHYFEAACYHCGYPLTEHAHDGACPRQEAQSHGDWTSIGEVELLPGYYWFRDGEGIEWIDEITERRGDHEPMLCVDGRYQVASSILEGSCVTAAHGPLDPPPWQP